ncbi:aminoglycoside adenylyltransferase domain-containing protein [Carnobacterium mobile]|uniref:aminoglycoside adenylyltransferase domain-containing protein n=1 Tax=Carnobacterium mobile TaxID=2750 RepID=UPI00068A7099|nr:aminoglycoside adenylyltransferase domain-containing protein [Carnobacterium mobile]
MDKHVLTNLNQLKKLFIQNLKENLVGIYIHGSIAYDCFNENFSDIDLIIVVRKEVTREQKISILKGILNLWDSFPKKGVEFSVVKEENCLDIKYPIPYELHFSENWLDIYKQNIELIINDDFKDDWDLVTYFKLLYSRGLVLYGPPIEKVFSSVPDYSYVKSIYIDIKGSEKELESAPESTILNLCRVLSFIYEGKILSKKESGEWCIEKKIINNVTEVYNIVQAYSGCNYMINSYEVNLSLYKQLFGKIEEFLSESREYKSIVTELT